MPMKEAEAQSFACGAIKKVWYLNNSYLIKTIDIQVAMPVKESEGQSLACEAINKVWYMIKPFLIKPIDNWYSGRHACEGVWSPVPCLWGHQQGLIYD